MIKDHVLAGFESDINGFRQLVLGWDRQPPNDGAGQFNRRGQEVLRVFPNQRALVRVQNCRWLGCWEDFPRGRTAPWAPNPTGH